MMNDTDNTQDRGLTTQQIAAAGTRTGQQDVPQSAGHNGFQEDFPQPSGHDGFQEDVSTPARHDDFQEDVPTPAGHDDFDDGNAGDADRIAARPATAGRGVPDAPGDGSAAVGPRPRASLLEDGELQNITARWKDIQAEFVDEPEQAVQQADALVAELMQRLATMFAAERTGLEERWAGGGQVSTEDLRQGLRRYRSFFERLLAA